MRRRISRRDALALLGATACASAAACQRTSPVADTRSGIDSMHYLGLREVARRIQAGDISPVALTRHLLDRIARIDPTLESYATVMADQAMAAAARAEQEIRAGKYRGALHGVPVGVKDLCYTRGVRTMGGAAVLRDFVPDVDATVVSRLQDAGAVILGKLNLTEGAMGGYHPDFGVPHNPWDTGRWPGLSSSGSGVAAAAGLCFGAIGTDTGGSIRFPSSANGVVGLKPTYGRVSRYGVLALAESLDHVGPMARQVADVAILYDAIAGHDAKDATSLADPVQSALSQTGQSIDGLRIGIDRQYALAGIDPGQAASIDEALKVLAELGARVVDVQMPDLTGMINAWVAIDGVEAVAAHATNFPSRAHEYGPYFRQVLEGGVAVKPEQLVAARKLRADLTTRFAAMLETVDAMACPAGGAPAFPTTRAIQNGGIQDINAAWNAALPRFAEFTIPMNLAGTPSICLPSGFSVEGLPYSIQFAGRRLSEPLLCRLAHAYEQATNWHTRHPAAFA